MGEDGALFPPTSPLKLLHTLFVRFVGIIRTTIRRRVRDRCRRRHVRVGPRKKAGRFVVAWWVVSAGDILSSQAIRPHYYYYFCCCCAAARATIATLPLKDDDDRDAVLCASADGRGLSCCGHERPRCECRWPAACAAPAGWDAAAATADLDRRQFRAAGEDKLQHTRRSSKRRASALESFPVAQRHQHAVEGD